MRHWKLTLVAATTAFVVPWVFVSTPAMKVVGGWNIKGLQEGLDVVTVEAAAGTVPMLRIEKKSAYEAGRSLSVFKNFSGVAWRARRIRMRYELEVNGAAAHSENEPVLVRASMQCGQYSDSTLETARSLEAKQSHYLDFKVPDDATACSYGFTTAVAGSIRVKSLSFEEADTAAPENDQLFPLPRAATSAPALEAPR